MLQLLYFTEPNSIRFFSFFSYISVATLARYWHNGDYIVRQIFAIRVSRSERWGTTMMVRRKREKRLAKCVVCHASNIACMPFYDPTYVCHIKSV